MVALRATARALRRLPPPVVVGAPSDGALGDWYLNQIVVDRRPLLVLVSATSLLAMVIPARDVRTLPHRFPALVTARLRRLGTPPAIIAAEVATLDPVAVAKTNDREALGILVLFSKELPFYLPINGWDETTLPFLEARLAEMPCRASGPMARYIRPERDAPRLLEERWGR